MSDDGIRYIVTGLVLCVLFLAVAFSVWAENRK